MKKPTHPPGFTLIETIVVMAIILLLAGIVVGSMGYIQGRQAREKAKAQIALLSKAIEEYKMDMGVYPGDPAPDSGYYGGQTADTAEGKHSNVLYRALFFEGWDFIQNDQTGDHKARKIYLTHLDPRDNKQGWVKKVATNAEVKPDLEIIDPWRKPYRYRRGTNAQNPDFDLWSVGKDGDTDEKNPDIKLEVNRDDIRNF
jgi:general secretion pathway protein G